MALRFAEQGIFVLLNDPGESTVDGLLKTAEKDGIRNKLEKHLDYEDLCKNLDSPKVFVFSLPHGAVGDTVVDGLHPYLEKGDLIIDASNENWKNTQRRQGKLVTQGVYYVVSLWLLHNKSAAVSKFCKGHGGLGWISSRSSWPVNVSRRRGSSPGLSNASPPEGGRPRRARKPLCRQMRNGRIRVIH